jgi:hypothetical protein
MRHVKPVLSRWGMGEKPLPLGEDYNMLAIWRNTMAQVIAHDIKYYIVQIIKSCKPELRDMLTALVS